MVYELLVCVVGGAILATFMLSSFFGDGALSFGCDTKVFGYYYVRSCTKRKIRVKLKTKRIRVRN